jgi:hypothetical protein
MRLGAMFPGRAAQAVCVSRAPLPSGARVEFYTLKHRHGMQARIATYGGILISLTAPDHTKALLFIVISMRT